MTQLLKEQNKRSQQEEEMLTAKDSQALDQHQQQILFNESELLMTDEELMREGTKEQRQIIFNNNDYMPVADEMASQTLLEDKEVEVTNKSKKPKWLLRGIVSLFIAVIGFELVDFFSVGFVQSPFITSLWAIILAGVTVLAGSALLREYISLKQFKRREILKGQAQTLLIKSDGNNEVTNGVISDPKDTLNVEAFCQKISDNLPCDLVQEQEQAWQTILAGEHSKAELVQLYSRVVLTKVDEKALEEVARYSTEAVALIALSPIAVLDMLIMLVRNLKMINKIAGLYGLKLGYWSRIKLIKQVFVNMVYAGASELIADFGSDMIGADLLGKLSGRLAQGLGAGLLTSRLGIKTIELCRPIPMDEKPKLSQVRKKMLTTIKGLLTHKT
ncbi:MAG: YcjF family protein [Colwellia sp.]